jgi:nucleoside diphosphate kinase
MHTEAYVKSPPMGVRRCLIIKILKEFEQKGY